MARHLVMGTLIVLVAGGCMHTAPRHSSARLIGVLWWLTPEDAHRTPGEWREDLDQLDALGVRLLILTGPYAGEDLAAGTPDPMEAFFTLADARGFSIYLDTLAAPDWWTLPDPAPELARACARIELLERRYGRHPSFAGWYIPYELYMFWGAQADLIRALYREVASCCKRVTPRKPVMISPFFILDREGYLGDFRWATPEEYQAFWTATLRQAPVDIVALQDSGEHLSCYTLEQRRPFFAAMKAACGAAGKQLWANVESGELHVASLDDYVARFGRKTHVNDPKTAPYWRGVPADKLAAKLRLAGEYTGIAVSWGYREFIRPSLGSEAQRLYESYAAALKPRR